MHQELKLYFDLRDFSQKEANREQKKHQENTLRMRIFLQVHLFASTRTIKKWCEDEIGSSKKKSDIVTRRGLNLYGVSAFRESE